MPGAIQIGATGSGPAYERISSIPSWFPTQAGNERELQDQYRNTNSMFDTGAYDQASEAQQSRILTGALNSGNEAAASYSNRARQAGGSGLGAGLVKAEAQTGARATAGDMELHRREFDASQRAEAAKHATGIATTLGQLRDSYLKSIVSYATSEDQISADYSARMAALRHGRGGGSGGGPMNPFSMFPAQIGRGLPNHGETNFNDYGDYISYVNRQIQQNPEFFDFFGGGG